MVGAAAGTALGALVWIAAQALAPNDMMTWGWRLVFLSSIFVTIAALVIRRKLDESPVFEEIKQARPNRPHRSEKSLSSARPTSCASS